MCEVVNYGLVMSVLNSPYADDDGPEDGLLTSAGYPRTFDPANGYWWCPSTNSSGEPPPPNPPYLSMCCGATVTYSLPDYDCNIDGWIPCCDSCEMLARSPEGCELVVKSVSIE